MRDTFDFSQKRIVFVVGSGGTSIISKKSYLYGRDLSDNKENNGQLLYIFTLEEKVQSGGYDAIILSWSKITLTKSRKQKIIKKNKICR